MNKIESASASQNPVRLPRLRGKTPCPAQAQPARSYAESWRQYIRGNVVSRHAKRIIVQFMAANCGKTNRCEDLADEHQAATREAAALPDNSIPLALVHGILDRMSERQEQPQRGAQKDDDISDAENEVKEPQRSKQVTQALQVTAQLWSRTSLPWPEGLVDCKCTSLSSTEAQIKGPPGNGRKQQHMHPRVAQSKAYITWIESCVQDWIRNLKKESPAPTEEQWAFLMRVIDRCKQEFKSAQCIAP